MNIEDFKKLSIPDAMKAAAGYAGVDASVFDGMWRAESARGTQMLSSAGAQGHFGLMPKTKALFEKKLGIKADPNDFHDSLFVAMNHLKEDVVREGGDVVSALRAYNNGPKWRTQRDPRGENAAYAARVLGADNVPKATAVATVVGQEGKADLGTKMPFVGEKDDSTAQYPDTITSLASASFVAGLSGTPQETVSYDSVVKSNAAASATSQAEIDNTGFIDTARAMFMHQGIVGGILKRAARPDYPEQSGYVVPEQMLLNYNADDQAHLLTARSHEEAKFLDWELQNEREDMRIASLHGGWYAAAAGIFAGLPEGVVTGVGTAKALAVAGMGSVAAVKAGQAGRAVALNVLENVGGNIAATAVEDAISGRMSLFDYAIAGSTGLVFSGLQAHGAIKASNASSQQLLAHRIATEAMQKQTAMAERAAKNLGEGATAEEIAAEISRLEVAEIKPVVIPATVSESRKLLPDMTKLEEDELAAEKVVPTGQSQDRATSDAAGMVSPNATNSPDSGKGVLSMNIPLAPSGNASFYDDIVKPKVYDKNTQFNIPEYGGVIRGDLFFERDYPNIDYPTIDKLPAGVHVAGRALQSDFYTKKAMETLGWLHKTFAPDMRIVLADLNESPRYAGASRVKGDAWVVGDKLAIIRLKQNSDGWQNTAVHEFGHVVFNGIAARLKSRGKAATSAFNGFLELHAEWQKLYNGTASAPAVPGINRALNTALRRGTIGSHYTRQAIGIKSPVGFEATLFDVMAGVADKVSDEIKRVGDLSFAKDYIPNTDEFAAEQFTKYIEAALAKELNWKPAIVPKGVMAFFKEMWDSFASLFNKAKEHGLLSPDERAVEFFDQIRQRAKAVTTVAKREDAGLDPFRGRESMPSQQMTPAQQDTAQRYGLDILPQATPAERAEQKALISLYQKAEMPDAPWNNIDPKWVDTLTAKFPAIGSTGLQMLRSKNPVARMVAAELLESTTGAGGRRSTAAIAKHMAERKYMGNTINDVQDAYSKWRNAQGGNIGGDITNGRLWQDFNRKVAEEIEGRRTGNATANAPEVQKAADVLETAYERMRIDQIDKKTTGWGALPATSKGYMPHRLSSDRVRNMSNEQARAFHAALVDQFVSIEGWDISFSANLASKYIDRARVRAMGGYDIPANVHQTGAADVVKDALTAMGMNQPEIKAQMEKFMRGGPGHTKQRLQIDLLQSFDDANGTFTLLDLFETDQLQLLRNQAQRVSGETALAKHGVMGKSGLTLLRRAMADFGANNAKAQPAEVQAFDQVAAEFMGDPFGDYGGKWMNRAMQVNSLARLGGMGFTQFAEFINAATHLGVTKAMAAVAGMPRLRKEAAELANGKPGTNSILTSLETFGGAEFGTDPYKMVFPFDNPSLQYQVNGHDTVTMADRLLRGGLHAQGKLSFWRAIHSAQQRGVAEQIVHKSIKFIRDGLDSKSLADIGITPQLASDMRAELANIATFDANGKLITLDITKAENVRAAEEFIQAVHRGTGQIIQGTFIGETGKWAHSGWLRLMTQFRTFSITSVEKQWARNRNNHGVAVAIGMMMGAMSVAAPIHMARVYTSSIGREDRDEYLEKQLSPERIARATLNYVAMSGLAGDFLDALSATTGISQSTGGRAGGTTEFVGTVVAPAAGLADDLWRSVQNSKDGTDIHEVAKNLPFSKLPWLVPAINALD